MSQPGATLHVFEATTLGARPILSESAEKDSDCMA